MTDDDHAVRLRSRVLFRHKGWCGGSNDGCTHWEADAAAYDLAIRYHEAKARVEERRMIIDEGWEPCWCLDADETKDRKPLRCDHHARIDEAEADLAAIIKEIEGA